jgi:hypothetical protein
MDFTEKTNHAIGTRIHYKNNQINNADSTNFLHLTLDSILSWKTHTDHLNSEPNFGRLLQLDL